MSKIDFEKLASQAAKSKEVAFESSRKGKSPEDYKEKEKPSKKKTVEAKKKSKIKAFGTLNESVFGGTKKPLRIIGAVDKWLKDNLADNSNGYLALNWLLTEGIKVAERKMKDGDIIITTDDLPKE